MRVRINFAALRQVKWHEVGIRFIFGGAITLIAAVLAQQFGPYVGGLFLAFPAIFPASVTLLAKKQEQKAGAKRGKDAGALEARGTCLGTIGLVCFGVIVWLTLRNWNSALVLLLATAVWLCIGCIVWRTNRAFRHWSLTKTQRSADQSHRTSQI
jgi:hypothetical protein